MFLNVEDFDPKYYKFFITEKDISSKRPIQLAKTECAMPWKNYRLIYF